MGRMGDEAVLNKMPVTRWVRGTADKMRESNTDSNSDWNRLWLRTYHNLGGNSDKSGSKACPRVAAYALWYLGRVRESGRQFTRLSVCEVRRKFGKNAAYAVIAADFLARGAERSAASLWQQVRDCYKRRTGEEAAESEQGEVKLVVALFCEGQIASCPDLSTNGRRCN